MLCEPEMSTNYRLPDPKQQLSARVRRSILAKVRAIVRIWREQAISSGHDDLAGEIDATYVVDSLLAKVTDDELAQWGGFPDTDARMEEVLKQIRKRSAQ